MPSTSNRAVQLSSRHGDPLRKKHGKQSSRALGLLAWSGASRVVLLLTSIGSVMILARLLTPEDYGLYAAAMIFINIGTSPFADGGFPSAIIQRPILTTPHVRNAFTGTLILNVVAAIAIWAVSGPAADFFSMPSLKAILQVMIVIVLLNAITATSTALIRRRKRFRTLAFIEVSSSIIFSTAVAIALALAGFGVWSLVISQLTLAISMAVLTFTAGRFNLLPLISTHMRELFRIGAGFSAGSMFNRIANFADNVIVGRALGADALGIYTRAFRLLTIPVTVIGTSSNQVLFPVMAGLNKEVVAGNDKGRMRRGHLRAISLIMLAGAPLSALIIHGADGFILLMLGDQWTAAIVPTQILFACLSFRIGMKVVGIVPMAMARVFPLVIRQAAFATMVVVGAMVGLRWGLEGVSVAVSLAFLITYLLTADLANRLIDVSWPMFARAHANGLLLAVCLYGVLFAGGRLVWLEVPILWQFPIEAVVAGLITVCLCSVAPKLFLGSDGIWLVNEVRRRAPARLRGLIPVIRA